MVVFLGKVPTDTTINNAFSGSNIIVARADTGYINQIYSNANFGINHSAIIWQYLDGSTYVAP